MIDRIFSRPGQEWFSGHFKSSLQHQSLHTSCKQIETSSTRGRAAENVSWSVRILEAVSTVLALHISLQALEIDRVKKRVVGDMCETMASMVPQPEVIRTSAYTSSQLAVQVGFRRKCCPETHGMGSMNLDCAQQRCSAFLSAWLCSKGRSVL